LHPQTDEEQDDREYVQAKVCDRLLARKLAGKGVITTHISGQTVCL